MREDLLTFHTSQVLISDLCLSSITDLQSSLICVLFLMKMSANLRQELGAHRSLVQSVDRSQVACITPVAAVVD